MERILWWGNGGIKRSRGVKIPRLPQRGGPTSNRLPTTLFEQRSGWAAWNLLRLQPGFGEVVLDGLEDTLDGEADDVGEGAFDALDEAALVLLSGVGAGFIEGVDVVKVGIEIDFVAGPKLHARGLDEAAHFLVADEADAGEDLVDATAEGIEHEVGLGEVEGFAKDAVVERDEGIGAKHKAAGETGGDFAGLAVGVEEAELAGGPGAAGELVNEGGLDLVRDAGLLEQVAAAGGGGG